MSIYGLLIVMVSLQTVSAGELVACENETATATCSKGYIIHIETSLYGRTDKNICEKDENSTNIDNCIAPTSLAIVKGKCNVMQTCSVKATNDVFGNPCSDFYKYLRINYKCLNNNDVRKSIPCKKGEAINIECTNKKIKVINAFYARETSKVFDSDNKPTKNDECNAPKTLNALEKICNSYKKCSLKLGNDVLPGDSCPKTHKCLEVYYLCK